MNERLLQQTVDDIKLLHWIIQNLLTDSQLDVIPPGSSISLRYRGEK